LTGGSDQPAVRGLVLRYAPNPHDAYTSRLVLMHGGSQAHLGPRRADGQGCFFISGRRATSVGEMASLLTYLSKNNQLDEFLEAIRRFDRRIVSVESGVQGTTPTVLVDLALATKLPINVLGDGFCRISLMFTGAFNVKSRILAIDEIDSGLHVSVMAAFWKSFAQLAESREKQVFCTTHNEEMLANTIEAFSECRDALRIFRIDRLKEGGVQATKYTYDAYCKSENMGWDIR
jgi:hypothetical protein